MKFSIKDFFSKCDQIRRKLKNTNTFFDFNNNNILLQTANVTRSGFNSNKTTDVIISFDAGNQKTYVTNDLKNYLHLPIFVAYLGIVTA